MDKLKKCIVSMNFQFSYLYTFYKPNNIKTKASAKVKTYIQI